MIKIIEYPIKIDNDRIEEIDKVKNLGLTLNKSLARNVHVVGTAGKRFVCCSQGTKIKGYKIQSGCWMSLPDI